MAKIIVKNLTLEIPLIGATRLFQKKIDAENFSEKNIGSSKILKDNKIYSRILDNVSFECNDGDNVALLGHNGSGKTTLLKVIAGIYHPSSGSIYTDGTISSWWTLFLNKMRGGISKLLHSARPTSGSRFPRVLRLLN